MLTSTELEPLQSGADTLYYQVSPLEYASKKLAKRNENSYKVTFQSCYNACNTFELVGHLRVYTKRDTRYHSLTLTLLVVTFLCFLTVLFTIFAYSDVWLNFLLVMSLFFKLYLKTAQT